MPILLSKGLCTFYDFYAVKQWSVINYLRHLKLYVVNELNNQEQINVVFLNKVLRRSTYP